LENYKFKIFNNENNKGVLAPKGFFGNGVKNGKYGVSIIYSKTPCIVAGTFTTNKVLAHPVIYCKNLLKENKDNIMAIVANSGNANCITKNGYEDNLKMIKETAKLLNIPENTILPCSTGVIGREMPMDIITNKIDEVGKLIKNNNYNNDNIAKAIMTTDSFPKTISVQLKLNNKIVNIGAVAKGAGMIAPNMLHATMFCFITTDININYNNLNNLLQNAVNESFNNSIVDGDTSTNDTVLILANGQSEVIYENLSKEEKQLFSEALTFVSVEMAKLIVKDGEGATKLMEVKVIGAKSKEDAVKVSKSVARSLLVKTALFGKDPNWGRIIASVGYSGIDFNINNVDIYIGNIEFNNSVCLMEKGVPIAGENSENLKIAENIMKKYDEIKILINLNNGNYKNSAYGCDLGYEYVRINSEYTT